MKRKPIVCGASDVSGLRHLHIHSLTKRGKILPLTCRWLSSKSHVISLTNSFKDPPPHHHHHLLLACLKKGSNALSNASQSCCCRDSAKQLRSIKHCYQRVNVFGSPFCKHTSLQEYLERLLFSFWLNCKHKKKLKYQNIIFFWFMMHFKLKKTFKFKKK